MTQRLKTTDDPLSGLFRDPDVETKPKHVSNAMISTNDDNLVLKAIDTDKINFKDKKVKSKNIDTSSVDWLHTSKESDTIFDSQTLSSNSTNNNDSNNSEVNKKSYTGLGLTTNLWDNDLTKSKPKDMSDLFGNESQDDSYGLFSSTVHSSSSSSSSASSQSIHPSTQFRVLVEDNDDDIQELQVTKLLERENLSNDYHIFGKSKEHETLKINQSKYSKEDLDMSNFERLSNLEKDIDSNHLSKNTQFSSSSSAITKSGGGRTISTDAVGSTDIDLTSLDLNDYIAKQQTSGGGLFD